GGAGACYISVNQTGRFAIVANYDGGSTAVFRLKDDGSFGKQTDFVQHKGEGVNKQRQTGPHPRGAVFARVREDKDFAYVVDLGLDKVYVFRLDQEAGKLSPAHQLFVKLPDGSGPRHIAFNEQMFKAYVCGELNSTLYTLRWDPSNGTLEP